MSQGTGWATGSRRVTITRVKQFPLKIPIQPHRVHRTSKSQGWGRGAGRKMTGWVLTLLRERKIGHKLHQPQTHIQGKVECLELGTVRHARAIGTEGGTKESSDHVHTEYRMNSSTFPLLCCQNPGCRSIQAEIEKHFLGVYNQTKIKDLNILTGQ